MAKSFICGVAGHVLTETERAFLAREKPYGVILFARNIDHPAQLQALTAEIKALLDHPYAAILIDQEGGRVARMRAPHWRTYPPARHFANKVATHGLHEAMAATERNARLIAEELLACGITTNCAPLADVLAPECHAIIGDRAFGEEPAQVAALAGAQARGLQAGGILSVLKHIPGHGRATCDSHEDLPVVHATLQELEFADFEPFRALKHLPLGMTAHITYTALDAQHCATQSPIVMRYIREEIGFDGLLMSDDLSMKALRGSYEARTEVTLAAGCDLALHCNGVMEEMMAVASASIPLRDEALRRAQAALLQLPVSVMPVSDALREAWERDVISG